MFSVISPYLCKVGIHDMDKVAHWCDKDCSVIIVEYGCTRCGHEAWDFVYFDDSRCKVLTRVPVEVTSFDAPKLVECEKLDCEISKQAAPKKRSRPKKTTTKG